MHFPYFSAYEADALPAELPGRMPENPGRPATTPTHPPHGTGPGGGACHRPVRGARRFRGTGLRGPVRIPPGRVRRFARHGGVEPPSTVLETVGLPLSRWRVHCFRSSVFNHAMPAVSAAAWHGMRPRTAGRRNAFRRPSGSGRLRSAGPPGFHRSPSIQWDWPDSESNRLSLRYCVQAKRSTALKAPLPLIRLFATRRIVVAGGLEPPVFPCRRFTVCCRRRWATPPVHRFCPSRCDAYRA